MIPKVSNKMKTKEELNAIKEEVETLKNKLAELTDEELTQVTGGKVTTGGSVSGKWNCRPIFAELAVPQKTKFEGGPVSVSLLDDQFIESRAKRTEQFSLSVQELE